MMGAEGGKGIPGRQHVFGGSEGTLLARAPRTKYHSLQLGGGTGGSGFILKAGEGRGRFVFGHVCGRAITKYPKVGGLNSSSLGSPQSRLSAGP